MIASVTDVYVERSLDRVQKMVRLREIMHQLGLKQSQMAIELNVSLSTFKQYITGRSNIPDVSLQHAEDILMLVKQGALKVVDHRTVELKKEISRWKEKLCCRDDKELATLLNIDIVRVQHWNEGIEIPQRRLLEELRIRVKTLLEHVARICSNMTNCLCVDASIGKEMNLA